MVTVNNKMTGQLQEMKTVLNEGDKIILMTLISGG
jgi:molybdopterin converting factor small subunit